MKIRMLLLLFFSSGIFAQQSLTLADAWAIARQNNLALQQQQVQQSQVAAEVRIQQSDYLPKLSVSAGAQYVSEIAKIDVPFLPNPIEAGVKERYDLSANLQQPIFTGFRTSNLVKAAKNQQAAAELQENTVEQQLFLQIGVLFQQIQLNLRQQTALRDGIARANDQLQLSKNRFAAAQVAAFDTLEAANRKLQLESQLSQLQNLNGILQTRMQLLLNSKSPVSVAEMPAETVDLQVPDVAATRQSAIENRTEFDQLRELQSAQAHRTGAIKSQFFPQIYGEAAYHYANPGVNFFKSEWMDYYTLGVGLQWQLFNGGKTRHQVQQSKLEIRKLTLQEQQLMLQVNQQIDEALAQLDNARTQIRFQRQLVAQEQERYRIATTAYEQGLATTLDVRNAETALTQAELLLQQRLIEWEQYRLQLDFATGVLGKDGRIKDN